MGVWIWDESSLVRLNHWPLDEKLPYLFFLRTVGKVFFSMDELFIYVRGSTMYGSANFRRHGLILSWPGELLFAIVEMHLPTSRTVIGGIQQLSSGFNVLPRKLLSKVEHTKLSVVHPLDWARVSANVKKCMLNKLGEMGGVVLFVFLDLFVISLMVFHIVEVLLSVSTSLSK